MELDNLDYTIKYFQGTDNIEADYLSRIPGSDKPGETPDVYNATVDDMLSKIIFKAQNEDSVISEVAVNLKDRKPIRTGPFKKYSNLQLSEAGLVCKGSRIIVPASVRELVITIRLLCESLAIKKLRSSAPSDRIPLVGRRAQNFTSHFGLQCVQKFSFFRYVSTAFSLPTVRYRYSNIPSSP